MKALDTLATLLVYLTLFAAFGWVCMALGWV